MKRIIVSSVVLLFGLAAVWGAITKLNDSTVDCGGRAMLSGDQCVSTSTTGDETGRKTVGEQKTSSDFGNWAVIGVGGLIALIGADNLRIGVRNLRKKPAAANAVKTPAAGWSPPGSPPRQGHPQAASQQGYPHTASQPYPQQSQHPRQPQPGWGPPPRR